MRDDFFGDGSGVAACAREPRAPAIAAGCLLRDFPLPLAMLALILHRLRHSFCARVVPMPEVTFEAEPPPLSVELDRTALVIIDMQRDFLEPGGFGETLGNDVSRLQAAVEPCKRCSTAARAAGMLVIHTREGHRPDLSDAPPQQGRARRAVEAHRRARPNGPHPHSRRAWPRHHPRALSDRRRAGDRQARQGRLLPDRSRIDAAQLRHRDLVVSGVTTEVCVNTTVREANDRGYRCIVLGDCCASYFPEFHEMGLAMIKAQGGIFGWVTGSQPLLVSLAALP